MDKQSLETAVSDAWDDLGTAAVLVKMAAQDYVDAAQETLAAFDDVQRQLTTIFMQNLSLEQASQLMAELRKQPAGQMTVAFAHDTQLQVKLKSANDGKQAYQDARQAWREAVDAAEGEGCAPTERFSQPDEVVDADQAIEAEAQITEKLDALRSAIEKGAHHVDTLVQNAQAVHTPAAEVTDAPVATATVESSIAAVVASAAPETDAEDFDSMLNGMAGDVSPAVAPSPMTPIVQPTPMVAAPDQPRPGVHTHAEPEEPNRKPITGMRAEVVKATAAMLDAVIALEGAEVDALEGLIAQAEEATKVLEAVLSEYIQEGHDPDPTLITDTKGFMDSSRGVVTHARQYLQSVPLEVHAREDFNALHAAADAYNAADSAADSNGRIRAQHAYQEVHERLTRAFTELKTLGHSDPDYLDAIAEAIDQGGTNLAMMANRTHVSATADEGIDAHDAAWGAKPARARWPDLTGYIKPVGIGVAALLVIVAGVWIGSSGSDPVSPVPEITGPASIGPQTVPTPVAPSVSVPAPRAVPATPPVPHATLTAPSPAVAPKPALAPAPVHRPPVVHHGDALAREQAQLNAANAKLDAWAKAHAQP